MDEMMKTIADAEELAAQKKSDAVVRAAQIMDRAREQAAEIARVSAAERAEYRDESLRSARIKAQQDYESAIAASRRQAVSYVDGLKGNKDIIAGKIAGRVISGNS